MAAFIKDKQAIMDLSFVQIGLAIVSAFFVLAGYVIIYENPMQSTSEIQTVAFKIKSWCYKIDSYWIEQSSVHLFPENTLQLNAKISQDHIHISSSESKETIIIPITQRLWIVSANTTLRSSEDWHEFLLTKTGCEGTNNDPIKNTNLADKFISLKWNQSQQHYYQRPLKWSHGEYISLEKCIIFEERLIDDKIKSFPYLEFIIIEKK